MTCFVSALVGFVIGLGAYLLGYWQGYNHAEDYWMRRAKEQDHWK